MVISHLNQMQISRLYRRRCDEAFFLFFLCVCVICVFVFSLLVLVTEAAECTEACVSSFSHCVVVLDKFCLQETN